MPTTVAYRILDERETISREWADALTEARRPARCSPKVTVPLALPLAPTESVRSHPYPFPTPNSHPSPTCNVIPEPNQATPRLLQSLLAADMEETLAAS